VVFCTAYDEHALAAFEAARDRLPGEAGARRAPGRRAGARAPLRPRRARAGAAAAEGGSARTHLCARLRGSLRLIPIADVRYLQAEEKYVVVHHAQGEDLIEESLKSLEGGVRRALPAHPPQLPGGPRRAGRAAPRPDGQACHAPACAACPRPARGQPPLPARPAPRVRELLKNAI
jgi:hypothetical protein